MARKISRDSFARQELYKEYYGSGKAGVGSCDWCGAKNRLYRFYYEYDDRGRIGTIKGIFCSVRCMRNYHG